MTEAKPLTPDEEQALRKAWASIDDWEQDQDAEAESECPLCCGDGYIDGTVFDAVGPVAATVVGYGIGEGLEAAQLVATSTGALLATLDAERGRIAELVAALERFVEHGEGCPACGMEGRSGCGCRQEQGRAALALAR